MSVMALMRIELRIPDLQDVKTERPETAPAGRSNAEVTPAAESATVSLQDSASLGALTARALQMPDVRQDRVDSVRQSLAKGQYRLDAKASAEGLRRKV